MAEDWSHEFLNPNDLDSQFDAIRIPGGSSDLYPSSSYTTTTAANPTFSYTIPAPYHNQLSYSGSSVNSGNQAYSSTGYVSTSHQGMHNPQSAAAAITAPSSAGDRHDRLQQMLSQLTPGSHEHIRCLSAYYALRIQLMAQLCKQAIESLGHVDPDSEASRKEWERQLAQYPEGTTVYNAFAEKYVDWYTTWFNDLRAALFSSDNEDEDDGSSAHEKAHTGLNDVSRLTVTDGRGKESRKVYRCPYYMEGCQTAPTRKADLERHVEAVHNKKLFFFCEVPDCSRSDKPDSRGGFTRRDHLIEHYRTVHQMTDRFPKKQSLKKDAGEGSSRKKRR